MALGNTEEYYKELAEKWMIGKITPEEEKLFSDWYNQYQDKPLEVPTSIARNEQEHHDRILRIIKMQLDRPKTQKRNHVIRYAIAASFALVLLSLVAYFTIGLPDAPRMLSVNQQDIAPGGNKATLTLSDGSVINLNDMEDGAIMQQEGVEIAKTENGLLSYAVMSAQDRKRAPVFNTISTPNGGQYQVILPDGTRVWLNAASSLRYPTSFSGEERRVTLVGEGYFEVAKNEDLPFKVETDFQEVTVLGTHFNVKAYHDGAATKTTLLEGSVSIHVETNSSVNNTDFLLVPGDQSLLSKNNEMRIVKVDTTKEIAWKSGVFSFQGSDIKNVMRELSRWYDVDVEFEGKMPDIKLWGEMDRNVTASEALEILKYFNLDYKIIKTGNTKKIIIS